MKKYFILLSFLFGLILLVGCNKNLKLNNTSNSQNPTSNNSEVNSSRSTNTKSGKNSEFFVDEKYQGTFLAECPEYPNTSSTGDTSFGRDFSVILSKNKMVKNDRRTNGNWWPAAEVESWADAACTIGNKLYYGPKYSDYSKGDIPFFNTSIESASIYGTFEDADTLLVFDGYSGITLVYKRQ